MNYKVFLALSVIILLISFVPEVTANEVFRGLSWGDPLEAIDPSFVSDSEYKDIGIDVYRKENENYNLGSVRLNRIEYHFFENKLFKIVVYVQNEDDNRESAEAMLEARYGKPKRAVLANKSTWQANDTTIVWHWPFPGTPDPRIIFSSDKLEKELSDYQKQQKAIQAAKDAQAW